MSFPLCLIWFDVRVLIVRQVEPSTMLFRNKVSPYQDKTLKGVVRETWLRGQRIFSREDGFEKVGPSGKLLLEQRKASK
jgi:allantoinase